MARTMVAAEITVRIKVCCGVYATTQKPDVESKDFKEWHSAGKVDTTTIKCDGPVKEFSRILMFDWKSKSFTFHDETGYVHKIDKVYP